MTVVYSIISLLLFAWLPFRLRFKLVTQANHFYIFWLRICCGLKVEVTGRENLPSPENGAVIVSNHQSEWETLFFQTLVRPHCVVLKKELIKIPLFGWALSLLNPIALDRSQRRNALKILLKEGKKRLKDNIPIVIFPQGTRMPVGRLGRFNKGGAMLALQNKVSLIPIAHNAGIYWAGRSYLKYPGQVRVDIGKPIPTQGRTIDEIHEDMVKWLEQHINELESYK